MREPTYENADPALQQELAVVAALRRMGEGLGPTPAERARMRQRLMAEFPAVVQGGRGPAHSLRVAHQRRGFPVDARARLVVAAAAALCLLMSLSGMSVLLARDAVPGDALYGFKRTAESAELGLTFGDQPKALKHLEFASTRVNEIEIMAEHADATGNWSAGEGKFVQALDDFDADATAGARLLTGLAVNGQASTLPALRSWAEQQKSRLIAVRAALPLAATARLDSTLRLLDRIIARSFALTYRASCVTVTSGARDELGLLPAHDTCKPIPVDGTASTVPLPELPVPPSTSPPNVVMPPSLLAPPSGKAVRVPDPKAPNAQPELPNTHNPTGVLPKPSQPGAKPLSPDPFRPLPDQQSPQPAAPLPPWLLQPRLLPPGSN
jgi:hypothetical protein